MHQYQKVQVLARHTDNPGQQTRRFSTGIRLRLRRGGKKEDDTNIEDILPPECGLSDGSHTKIVGGNPAELGAWPWIAALGYRNVNNPSSPKWLCGGTLITSTHVLTAAHCAYRRTDLFMVRVGALHLNDVNDGAHPVDLLIQQQIIHPQYSPSTFTNDIAVLRLQGSVPLSLHMPICLPLPEKVRNKNYEYSFPFVAGWGSIQFRGPRSLILQEVQLPVVNLQSCKNAYDKFKVTIIDDRVICAGFARGGKDACEGDSGGPLMTYSDGKYYLLGVVSYGHQCALPGIPGVYSNVITFTDFILGALKRQ
ncbi:hypothetical protein KM043_002370 [Ampulex compressa]|nr:hypothetical protein KM043_002370 [Ampulex compressa]